MISQSQKPDQVTEITLGQRQYSILTDFKRLHFRNEREKQQRTVGRRDGGG